MEWWLQSVTYLHYHIQWLIEDRFVVIRNDFSLPFRFYTLHIFCIIIHGGHLWRLRVWKTT